MHVILRQFPDDLVDVLKSSTGENTASKAITTACFAHVAQRNEIARLKARIVELETANRVQRSVIEGARSAAAILLDQTSQGDLLTRI